MTDEKKEQFRFRKVDYYTEDGMHVIDHEPMSGEPSKTFQRFIGVSIVVDGNGNAVGQMPFKIQANTLDEAFDKWKDAKKEQESINKRKQIVTGQALPAGLVDQRGILLNRHNRRANGNGRH